MIVSSASHMPPLKPSILRSSFPSTSVTGPPAVSSIYPNGSVSYKAVFFFPSDVSTIAGYINTYGVMDAQFWYNNKIFVSSFIGDGFDWRAVEAQSKPLFACPNWQAASLNSSNVDGAFSWDAVSQHLMFNYI